MCAQADAKGAASKISPSECFSLLCDPSKRLVLFEA